MKDTTEEEEEDGSVQYAYKKNTTLWCIVAPIKTSEHKHSHADEAYNKI